MGSAFPDVSNGWKCYRCLHRTRESSGYALNITDTPEDKWKQNLLMFWKWVFVAWDCICGMGMICGLTHSPLAEV